MNKDLKELIEQEETAKKNYDDLMAAKQKEVEAATAAIESKIKRIGGLGIEIVQLKEDLDDTTASFIEDKKFLADLEKGCATKEKEWAVVSSRSSLSCTISMPSSPIRLIFDSIAAVA